MNPIPESELSAIEARCNAATQGPWVPNVWYGTHDGDWTATGPIHPPNNDDDDNGPGCCAEKKAQIDATLIASARTDLPKLLAAYREALTIIGDLRQFVEHGAVCRDKYSLPTSKACDCGLREAVAKADAAVAGKEKA